MADEYQIEYEYTDGNTISFKTNDLEIDYHRPTLKVDTRVDGTRVVTDTGAAYRTFTFSAVIKSTDPKNMKDLNDVQMGSITYSGAYPRIKKLYFDGTNTESNIEVALTSLKATQISHSSWRVNITLEEKDQ